MILYGGYLVERQQFLLEILEALVNLEIPEKKIP
jgi:hypothetical protein